MREEEIKRVVRSRYAKVAQFAGSCCSRVAGCCGNVKSSEETSKKIGYSEEDLKLAPEGANLGLGCGNPTAFASLREGETVLDLGSGAGLDCFIAAEKVGKPGRVIGVDMTPEMIDKARENARNGNYGNTEFRLGEIENLPVGDGQVDVIISNCVINLSPDKRKVFRESFRVLKAGGRLMVSDIVLLRELPDSIKNSIDALTGCISGAILKDEYIEAMRVAGFREIRVISETAFPTDWITSDPIVAKISTNLKLSPAKAKDLAASVVSIKIAATKPVGGPVA